MHHYVPPEFPLTDDTGRVPINGNAHDGNGTPIVMVPMSYYGKTMIEEITVRGDVYRFTTIDDYTKRAVFTQVEQPAQPDADSSAAGYVTLGPVS